MPLSWKSVPRRGAARVAAATMIALAELHAHAQAKVDWRSIVANEFAVPDGLPLEEAMDALVGMSESNDPLLRDDIGYNTFARWLHREPSLDGAMMARWHDRLLLQARKGLGEAQGDLVFARSFALLYLKELVFASQRTGFLVGPRLLATIDTAVDALRQERDARGWTGSSGWAHALAHVADLCRALGRHPALEQVDRERLVDALTWRLRTQKTAFEWGEDTRIAMALAALHAGSTRPAWTTRWFAEVGMGCDQLWRGTFDPVKYRAVRNATSVVQAMIALDGARSVKLPEAVLASARKAVLQCQ